MLLLLGVIKYPFQIYKDYSKGMIVVNSKFIWAKAWLAFSLTSIISLIRWSKNWVSILFTEFKSIMSLQLQLNSWTLLPATRDLAIGPEVLD